MSDTVVNSIGMTLVRIEPGSFLMGQADGDYDERPVHRAQIASPFWMATTPVTNAQYEQFDPAHCAYRGLRGLSNDDDEPVLFVSWHDAAAFCDWLSERESTSHKKGGLYRLPTETEWEYACRAGTDTAFYTGDALPEQYHRHQHEGWHPTPVPLHVGRTPANAWGLHDMHGIVEEWCYDWYGPYRPEDQIDPVGCAPGLFKVTRGGSHNVELPFLRSANRLGTLPEDKHWLIGFRIVKSALSTTKPKPSPKPKLWATGVPQTAVDWRECDPNQPYFAGPVPFVRWPEDPDAVPMYLHNHCPSLTWCDNGDLLAVWFSCVRERGREMTILGSRLRGKCAQWDLPSEFFNAPDRNMTGSALFNDGKGTLYHFNGLEAAGMWANLALVMRTSTDNGVTWSKPRLINSQHQPRNQVISGTSMTQEGYLIQPCDAVYGGHGGTAIHVSRDDGLTWVDPGAGTLQPDFQYDPSGGTIAGIHAGVVQLKDGSLLAFGRGDNIGERMPMSRSSDMGETWTYAASPFPPIDGGQRLVLMRLREGPLLFVSFTDSSARRDHPDWPWVEGMVFTGAEGKTYRGYGLFAALSFDEGASWPVRRLITPGHEDHELDGGAWTSRFVLDAIHAEPRGYMAATQTPDGVIHLISSALHYRFNMAWLT
ncbi:MAG: SUMF1/EgtB/PvdO family nonheme iron enzyme [Anaerolineae bacterium]|nr:SUMF1/EgtB/PvdO family nonheme iron enzyme [Anaerolineae bacterium]